MVSSTASKKLSPSTHPVSLSFTLCMGGPHFRKKV
jgi:hypothetical protein